MENNKIYSGKGDKGDTNLASGEIVSKSHMAVEAYGSLDEVNSYLGLSICEIDGKLEKVKLLLEKIQRELFYICSLLSCEFSQWEKYSLSDLDEEKVFGIEKLIDEYSSELDPLANFILPGGSKASSILHIVRSKIRTAERSLVKLREQNENQVSSNVLMYINRLSDLFFVLTRYINKKNEIPDVIWKLR